jgi:hypothetical protein
VTTILVARKELCGNVDCCCLPCGQHVLASVVVLLMNCYNLYRNINTVGKRQGVSALIAGFVCGTDKHYG